MASTIIKAVLSICNKYIRLAESVRNSPLSTCPSRCEPALISSLDFAVFYNSLQPGCWKYHKVICFQVKWFVFTEKNQGSVSSTRNSRTFLKPGVRAWSCFIKTVWPQRPARSPVVLGFPKPVSQIWEANVLSGKSLSCSRVGVLQHGLASFGKTWAEGEARVREVYQQNVVVFHVLQFWRWRYKFMTLLNGWFSKSPCRLWNAGDDLSHYFQLVLHRSNYVGCKCYSQKIIKRLNFLIFSITDI